MESNQGSILMVDDEEKICNPLGKFLCRQGFNVTALTNSLVALELIQKQSFSTFLLDVNMPDVSGLELAVAARRRNSAARIIFVTGELNDAALSARLSAIPGAILLHKPYDLKDLLKLLKGKTPGQR